MGRGPGREDEPAASDRARRGDGAGDDPPRYRVVHHPAAGRGAASVLALVAGVAAHHTTLAPYASHLRLGGQVDGDLALVDAATGAVVARLRVRPLLERAAAD